MREGGLSGFLTVVMDDTMARGKGGGSEGGGVRTSASSKLPDVRRGGGVNARRG